MIASANGKLTRRIYNCDANDGEEKKYKIRYKSNKSDEKIAGIVSTRMASVRAMKG
jgi:hypothetical protein